MPSLFYKDIFERRFPLSYLFFEDLEYVLKALEAEPTDNDLRAAIKGSLKKVYPALKVNKDDISYVIARLEKLSADTKKQEEEAGDTKKKKSRKADFASSYSAWVGKLSPHEVCLVAASMDYFQAKRLYAEVDRDDVIELSSQWMKCEWEKIKVGYESVVYGFGGGYKEGAPTDTEVDVSTDDPRQGTVIDKAALAAVKF